MIPRVMFSAKLPRLGVVGMVLTKSSTAVPMAFVNLTLVRKGGRCQREQQKERQDECEDRDRLHFGFTFLKSRDPRV